MRCRRHRTGALKPLRPLAAAGAGLLSALAGLAHGALPEPDFATAWVDAHTPLVLHIDPEQQQQWRRWRVFVGISDVTVLLHLTAPGRLELVPGATRWSAGEGALVVYDGDDWSELARWPLKVRAAGGFERSTATPRLGLQWTARAAERRSDGQPVSPRGTHDDLALTAGAQWEGTRNDWTMNAAVNLSGSSHRGATLRSGTLGSQAPKVDLADYVLSWRGARGAATLGHMTANAHPLLAQGLSSRGIGLRGALGPAMDLSLNVLHGTALVGWDDLTGLEEADHQARLLTLGVELMPQRPAALRAEFSLIDASLLARTGFNTGSVPDAEHSRGFGLRLVGASEGGRISGELALARSRFTNPFDAALALDGELRAVQPATRTALSAALQVGLLRQWPLAGQPLDLSLDLRHERAAPQYRSLVAYVTPDQALSRAALQATLAGASAQLQLATRVDNLDRIATLLRTRTDEWHLALNLPLAAWWGDGAGAPGRWPSLGWTSRHSLQQAVNAPVTEDSGFAASQRPDQVDRAQQLSLSWATPFGAVSYGLARSSVDNRQPGREQADFLRLAHHVGADASIGETLRVAVSLQRSRQLAVETGLVNWSTGGSVQLAWQPSALWSLTAALDQDRADDSRDLARQRQQGLQLQLTRRLEAVSFGYPLRGQVFVRLARQHQRQNDQVFALQSAYRSGWVDFGLSLDFF